MVDQVKCVGYSFDLFDLWNCSLCVYKMNSFNKKEIEEDESGLLESCDRCNAIIQNWDRLEMSCLSNNGKDILCKSCKEAEETILSVVL